MNTEELYSYFKACGSVSTDTRNIHPGSLFFALKGNNFDANAFAAEALEKGAKYAVIDNPIHKTSSAMLLVADCLQALQALATFHRRELGLPVLALTGSNGKTTTKELINAVLAQKYNVKATVGNLNNHIGVPLTLLSFTTDNEIGIVEMGANHQKEIEFLCDIAEPNFGYITNFGKAHLEGFGGVEGVIKGKSEMYDYLEKHTKTAFVNLDDPIQRERTKALPRFTFSSNTTDCDIKIEAVTANPMVSLNYNGLDFHSNLIGIYNAANLAAAIAIGSYFKVSDSKIKAAIEGYVPANNRSQLIDYKGNKIIMDAYNANPSSMAAALENFMKIQGNLAILGDMFELGSESADEHQKTVQWAADKTQTQFIFVGKYFYSARVEKEHLYFFEDYEGLKKYLEEVSFKDITILIKGSRGMALERVLELL